jgi:hypothetical protein
MHGIIANVIKLKLKQGIDSGYRWPITDANKQPVDLTGYTAKCQVRSENDFVSTILAEMDTAVHDSGVDVIWTAVQSFAWNFQKGFFDVVLIDPAGKPVQIVAEGEVFVNRVVTHV